MAKEKYVPSKQQNQTWTHGNEYYIDWTVTIYDTIYVCKRDHIANIFANDLHEGCWYALPDYSDEVTDEQMQRLREAYAYLEMQNWKSLTGPAW